MKRKQDSEAKAAKKPKAATTAGRSSFFYFSDLTFRWNEEFLSHDEKMIKSLFVTAYTQAYSGYSPKEIAIHSEEKISDYFATEFDQEWKKIKSQQQDKRIHYLVVRYCDHPIGFISCELNPKSGRIYLRWVTVSPACQRQGIGEKMLNAVLKHFPDNLGLELYTRVANKGSQTFYKTQGCEPVTQINFLEPDDQKLIPHFMKQ